MKTIVYAHPYEKSFNHAILTTLTDYFKANDEAFNVIDLYADNFEPGYTKEELRLFSRGETPYELVKQYQKTIAQSDELIMIAPIWWHNLPAELKGFIDKVMLRGFAYNEGPDTPWEGLLTYIKKATVITTATMTQKELVDAGDPIQGVLINTTLTNLGIKQDQINWIHFGEANLTTDTVRQQFPTNLPTLYQA